MLKFILSSAVLCLSLSASAAMLSGKMSIYGTLDPSKFSAFAGATPLENGDVQVDTLDKANTCLIPSALISASKMTASKVAIQLNMIGGDPEGTTVLSCYTSGDPNTTAVEQVQVSDEYKSIFSLVDQSKQ